MFDAKLRGWARFRYYADSMWKRIWFAGRVISADVVLIAVADVTDDGGLTYRVMAIGWPTHLSQLLVPVTAAVDDVAARVAQARTESLTPTPESA